MQNPVSIPALLQWVEQQPAEKMYDYGDGCGCAFFRYGQHIGLPIRGVGSDAWYAEDWSYYKFPGGFDGPMSRALSALPHTYGALAERLRGAL